MKNPYLKLQNVENKAINSIIVIRNQDYRSVWNKEMFPCVQNSKLPKPGEKAELFFKMH